MKGFASDIPKEVPAEDCGYSKYIKVYIIFEKEYI